MSCLKLISDLEIYKEKKSVWNRPRDYLLFENYQKTNKTLSDQIALLSQANLQAKVYVNSYMAVHDVCFGLIHFLAHKPKVSVIRLGSSLPESLLPHFYRLQTPISFKKENETNLQFLNSFDHEMNFTLWSAENEITGEILMSTASRQEIHKTLSAKRIYSIEIKSYFDDSDIETLKSIDESMVRYRAFEQQN